MAGRPRRGRGILDYGADPAVERSRPPRTAGRLGRAQRQDGGGRAPAPGRARARDPAAAASPAEACSPRSAHSTTTGGEFRHARTSPSQSSPGPRLSLGEQRFREADAGLATHALHHSCSWVPPARPRPRRTSASGSSRCAVSAAADSVGGPGARSFTAMPSVRRQCSPGAVTIARRRIRYRVHRALKRRRRVPPPNAPRPCVAPTWRGSRGRGAPPGLRHAPRPRAQQRPAVARGTLWRRRLGRGSNIRRRWRPPAGSARPADVLPHSGRAGSIGISERRCTIRRGQGGRPGRATPQPRASPMRTASAPSAQNELRGRILRPRLQEDALAADQSGGMASPRAAGCRRVCRHVHAQRQRGGGFKADDRRDRAVVQAARLQRHRLGGAAPSRPPPWSGRAARARGR